MKISLLVEGGGMQPGPALSQKIGPLGVNMGQVIQKVNQATGEFKGMKVPVEVDIDTKTKEISVEVFSPPVSELIKKELGLEKGSGEQKTNKAANASIEQIISVAKNKLPNIIAKDLKAAVKEVVGSCVSLGVLIEGKPAEEAMKDVEKGKFDKAIQEERTETSDEKKKKLEEQFQKVKKQEELKIKQAEEEAAAEEAAKAEAEAEAKEGEEKEGEEPEKAEEEKKEEEKPEEKKPEEKEKK